MHKGRMLWSRCDNGVSLSHGTPPCNNRGNPVGQVQGVRL